MNKLLFEKKLYDTFFIYINDITTEFNTVCGFALTIDSDFSIISPAFDLEENYIDNYNNDPSDHIYYRWSPGEWSYELYKSSIFNEVNFLLSELNKNYDDSSIFKNDIIDCISNVYNKLRINNVVSKNTILSFTITDTDEYEYELKVIYSGNRKKDYEQFHKWVLEL
ncbi:DUF4303 domain-containing protein [Photobacterium damselae subsp. damselae]